MRIASIREKHFLLTLRYIQEPGTKNMLSPKVAGKLKIVFKLIGIFFLMMSSIHMTG